MDNNNYILYDGITWFQFESTRIAVPAINTADVLLLFGINSFFPKSSEKRHVTSVICDLE